VQKQHQPPGKEAKMKSNNKMTYDLPQQLRVKSTSTRVEQPH